jgi:hypothetical protein
MRLVDKQEAQQIASERLETLQKVPYPELVDRYFRQPQHEEAVGPSGSHYDVQIVAFWDSPKKSQNLRVRVSVDDGVGRFVRSVPFADFILAPDGTFIGE